MKSIKLSINFGIFYSLICLLTSMIGYQIHQSIFFSIIDFLFTPFIWAKWLIFHEVNISIIKHTFEFFFK